MAGVFMNGGTAINRESTPAWPARAYDFRHMCS
jgi:hypothetical protein